MYCTISGEVPQEPIISKNSGHLFERRLIEKSLEASNGVCPATGTELKTSDLIAVKADLAVRPRQLTATSLPGMLAMFQNEWDDLMLEAHATKQQLHATRKELSHSLYQHDAACRVIARLIKERDEARQLVLKLQHGVAGGRQLPETSDCDASTNASTAPSCARGLDRGFVAHMTEFWKRTSKQRKKRAISKQLSTCDTISDWSRTKATKLFSSKSGATDVAICQRSGAVIITGGASGLAWLASADAEALTADSIAETCTLVPMATCMPGTVFATSGNDMITIWRANGGVLTAEVTVELPSVTSVEAHPTGDYVAAMTYDAAWSLFALGSQLGTSRELMRAAPVDASANEHASAPLKFHPDGLILATPTTSFHEHFIRIWDVKEHKHVHSFDGHSAPISCVAFSENGYYMASAAADATIKVWDLRKLCELKTLDISDKVCALAFDNSGKYLAYASPERIQVTIVKEWTVLCDLETDGDTRALDFGINATFLAAASSKGQLDFFAANK